MDFLRALAGRYLSSLDWVARRWLRARGSRILAPEEIRAILLTAPRAEIPESGVIILQNVGGHQFLVVHNEGVMDEITDVQMWSTTETLDAIPGHWLN